MSDSAAVLETRNLSKSFCDFWGRPRVQAVEQLNLTIRQGEVFGLLGPNGSGKSTTIKMLLDLLRPTHGRIAIFGGLPGDLTVKARVGYLPEESHLYPYLTGEETLQFFARLFDLSPEERASRVAGLINMVGLGDDRRRRVGEYSKGMQRRLGLAQALLNDPDLIILDEPTSGLDPLGMREVKDLLRHLARRGKTVLMCSHLLAEVEDVCDRVHILYQGHSIASGTLDELLDEPNQMQLTLPVLSDDDYLRVVRTIQAVAGPDSVVARTPHRSLESFFISQVHRARQAQVEPAETEPVSDANAETQVLPLVDEAAVSAAGDETQRLPLPELEAVPRNDETQQEPSPESKTQAEPEEEPEEDPEAAPEEAELESDDPATAPPDEPEAPDG